MLNFKSAFEKQDLGLKYHQVFNKITLYFTVVEVIEVGAMKREKTKLNEFNYSFSNSSLESALSRLEELFTEETEGTLLWNEVLLYDEEDNFNPKYYVNFTSGKYGDQRLGIKEFETEEDVSDKFKGAYVSEPSKTTVFYVWDKYLEKITPFPLP